MMSHNIYVHIHIHIPLTPVQYGRTVLHYACLFAHQHLLHLFLSLPSMSMFCLTIPDYTTKLPALYPSKALPIHILIQIFVSALKKQGDQDGGRVFQQYAQYYRDEVTRRNASKSTGVSSRGTGSYTQCEESEARKRTVA
ncbi:hypothetical protein EON63_22430, partial [archaeon]